DSVAAVGAAADAPEPSREALRDDWLKIRQKLIDIAFAPEIGGRTRAAYSRIDLRDGYRSFVDRLAGDGRLGNQRADFERATEIWTRYRANRAAVDPQDANEMRELARKLA